MKEKRSVFKRIINVLLTIVLILLVVVVAITMVVRITGNTPNFGGYMIFRVSTGSMEPELNVGDVILSKEVESITDLKVGDVITYMGAEGSYADKLITHEIVTAPYEENGAYYLVTQGIANPEADPVVSENQVVGIMVTKIPFLGAIYSFFLTPWGLIAAILLIILAFSGEFWNIYKLSHSSEDAPDTKNLDSETIEKAIEQYKKEKSADDTAEDNKNNNDDT